ncbi:MAG TPA: hypothetical protein VE981_11525 [Planctomycetota bacterium]|nr:hypothetical protein [Planctomycetota bacterium]
MGICMAVVLAAGLCQENTETGRWYLREEERSPVAGILEPRAGVWVGRDFKFEANRTDGLQSLSKQEALFSAELMGGIELYDHLQILASIEGDIASKITAEVGGLYLGWRQRPKERYGKGVPDVATVYAGVLFGKFEVHEDNFGDFDRGVGFAGGFSLGWELSPAWAIDFIAEYRYLKFDYKMDVSSGDTSIGGNAVWVGVGMNLRF